MTHRIEGGRLVENENPRADAKVVVMRHAHGITLNPVDETLLDENGNDMVFDNESAAREFLVEAGFDDESMEFLFFVEIDDVPEEEKA